MAIEDELQVIIRICERWAVSVSGGAPAAWADTVESRPPPLPDDLALEVDQAIVKAPGILSNIIRMRYIGPPYPNAVIARRCGLRDEDQVPVVLRYGYYYLRGTFEQNGVLKRFTARCRS